MKFSKAAIIIIVICLLIGIGTVVFFNYKKEHADPVSGLKPKVEMGIGRISNITDSTIDLSLKLLVYNPLPVGFDIKGFDYFVKMNEVTILESKYEEPLLVKKTDSSTVLLPTQLKIKKLAEEGKSEAKKGEDSANYHFEALFHLAKPFLGKDTIRLSSDKRLPLYRLPKVKLIGYDVEKFRLSKSEIVIQLEFSNQNAFPVQFKNPSYAVDLGKQKRLGAGKNPGSTKIPAKSTQIYDIPLTVDMGELLKAAGQMISKGKSLPFTLYFKSKLVSDNDIFKDSDVNIIVNGELKDLEKVKKNMSR